MITTSFVGSVGPVKHYFVEEQSLGFLFTGSHISVPFLIDTRAPPEIERAESMVKWARTNRPELGKSNYAKEIFARNRTINANFPPNKYSAFATEFTIQDRSTVFCQPKYRICGVVYIIFKIRLVELNKI